MIKHKLEYKTSDFVYVFLENDMVKDILKLRMTRLPLIISE